MKRLVLLPLVVLLLSSLAMANTPGRKSVLLSWTASTTPGVTYNIYRDTIAGVCSGTVTPYGTSTTTSFVDTNVTLGTTYFYNVSAVGTGGESACDGEVTAQVPTITTTPPSNDTATIK